MGMVRKPMVPDGPVRLFFDRLHGLHAAAGHPSMRELQRRTRGPLRPNGINPTTIHDAMRGPRLASWDTVRALVVALGGRPGDLEHVAALWRAGRRTEAGAEADGETDGEPEPDPTPVPGPAPVVPAPRRHASAAPSAPVEAPPSTAAQGPAGAPAGASASASASVGAPAGAAGGLRSALVPLQLPSDVVPFVGRAVELAALDRIVTGVGPAGPGVTVLTGTAGVGKTAVAVHWAHRAAAAFPDGQLFVDLRGYDPELPVPPAEALAGFLRALGVPHGEIPDDVAERAARYRSLLAGRRMLVVLDNAADAEHVRPLLPGTPCSPALVTSRDSLAGLVVRSGARRVPIERFRAAEATDLLRALLPGAADPVLAALVRRCAGLPLALRVAAAPADARGAAALAGVAAGRRGVRDFHTGDDPRTALHEVFSWSYRRLPRAAARLFVLACGHGRELGLAELVALTGVGVDEAARLVDALVRSHLMERVRPDRFQVHELLRAFAADLPATPPTAVEPDAVRAFLPVGGERRTSGSLTVSDGPDGARAFWTPAGGVQAGRAGPAVTARDRLHDRR